VKLIIAIIQPTKLQAVKEALGKIEVTRMTITDAQGYGRQRGHTEMFRGHEYRIELLSKVELQILVNDDFLEPTIETILKTARTGADGNIGDGKLWVLPADEAIRISDGMRGMEAV
jgi:nitrogen regulatory protein P-II 2